MNKLISIILSVVAVIAGIAFVVVGIVQIANKDKYDSTVTATIVDIQEEWETATDPDDVDRLVKTAYIDYEINGVKYEHVLSPEQDDNYKVGDTVEILYQSEHPEKISSKNITLSAFIFIGLGLAVAVFGCVSTLKSLKAR